MDRDLNSQEISERVELARVRSIQCNAPRWMSHEQVDELIARNLSVEETRKIMLTMHSDRERRHLTNSLCNPNAC